ncbi:MAG: HD domain-containing phosphohydrolase [Anaerolineales bacterium]
MTQLLKNAELRYRCLFEAARDGILILDAETGMIADVNPCLIKMLGYSREELTDKKLGGLEMFKAVEAGQGILQSLLENETTSYEDLSLKAKDGKSIRVELASAIYLEGDRKMIQCNIRDVTEYKCAEEVLRERERRFRSMVINSPDVIYVLDVVERRLVFFNRQGFCGYSRQELQASNLILDAVHPDDLDAVSTHWDMLLRDDPRVDMRQGIEYRFKHKDGAWEWVQSRYTVLARDQEDRPTQVLVTLALITEQRQAKTKMQQRLRELEVLYESSMMFSRLMSPKAIAEKMLDLLAKKMNWHHTVIRQYHPESDTLELLAFNLPQSASQEERSVAEERFKTLQRPSQGLSGWVVQNGQALRSNDLKKEPRYFEVFSGVCCGLYVPIKIAERVIGAISIESERPKAFSLMDERLVIALARQAATAMDDAQLFDHLKHSNTELASAYDATIENCARALDLRDKNEGHSQRVTEMALRLAQSMGVSEEEMAHIRRGALLHDIGKMSVPDRILLKPGPLTDKQWAVMKKHPIFAYEMLSPIQYLQPALDIPYCHHEKWDGSGYPRGLKGVQIPLAARIFAVVNVWDALCSDRPYRARWAEEEAREYISSSSGAHFDPQVVDAFMQMLQ